MKFQQNVTRRFESRSRSRTAGAASQPRAAPPPDAAVVWSSDPYGWFSTRQNAWEMYTGQSWERHAGLGWIDAVHRDDRCELIYAWARASLNQTALHVQLRLWHGQSGAYRGVVMRGVQRRGAAGATGSWAGTLCDVEHT